MYLWGFRPASPPAYVSTPSSRPPGAEHQDTRNDTHVHPHAFSQCAFQFLQNGETESFPFNWLTSAFMLWRHTSDSDICDGSPPKGDVRWDVGGSGNNSMYLCASVLNRWIWRKYSECHVMLSQALIIRFLSLPWKQSLKWERHRVPGLLTLGS